MREMKDSGIEWIGKIPMNWGIKSIRYLVDKHFGGSWGNNEKDNESDRICMRIADFEFEKMQFKDTEMSEYTMRNYTAAEIYSKTLRYGDVLIEKSGGGAKTPVGRIVVYRLPYNALFANFMDCIRLNKQFDVEFAKYVFYALYNSGETNLYFNQTTGIQNLNVTKFLREGKVPLPLIKEQLIIAAFLDHKCSDIDALTADIEKEIETLEAYKKSVISEAVTRGLDPNVKMKDSGIEWIGRVPAHWKVEKIKYNLERHEIPNPGNQQILSVYREYGVIPKDSRDDNHNVTSKDTSKYKYVKPEYLVINKMKAWQGSLGVSDYEGVVSPAYFIYKFTNSSIVPKFIHFLLRGCYKNEFRRISGGIREGQWDLSPEAFNNTMILIPSRNEQKKIIEYLENKCIEINAIIAEKQKQLEKLADYKKSLIYEYVTGKKEVAV